MDYLLFSIQMADEMSRLISEADYVIRDMGGELGGPIDPVKNYKKNILKHARDALDDYKRSMIEKQLESYEHRKKSSRFAIAFRKALNASELMKSNPEDAKDIEEKYYELN